MRSEKVISSVVVLVAFIVSSLESQNPNSNLTHSLAIFLTANKTHIAIGDSLMLRVGFNNEGTSSFYVELPAGFGPDDLNIFASRDQCIYEITPIHYDRNIDDVRFDLVPLSSGDTFERTLTPINDVASGSYPMLRIPGPGQYRVWATYLSKDRLNNGNISPFWQGTVESPKISIIFERPPQKKVEDALNSLSKCISGRSCAEAVQYFRLVRSPQAAELLSKLLLKDPFDAESTQIADALAFQGRKADSVIFEELSLRTNGIESIRSYYATLSQKLRATDPCAR
jgi:hypothetical protein